VPARDLGDADLPAGVAPPAETAPPAGIRMRPFEPGRDERAWLELNRRVFAAHPEQGRWTEADLRSRRAEPWFDPAGFLLAEAGGRLAGYHWTKVHPQAPPALRRPGPAGEVYVLGVDPDFAGIGLGRALLGAGLRHLRERGVSTVMLYVDEDNAPAVRLYAGHGFVVCSRDVSYVAEARIPRNAGWDLRPRDEKL
jgi:mycothiol synthase